MEKVTFYINPRYKQFLLSVKEKHGVPQVETVRRALDCYRQQNYPDLANGLTESDSHAADARPNQ